MGFKIAIKLLIFCLLGLQTSCFPEGPALPGSPPDPGVRDLFRIDFISGDRQTYVGYSLETIKFKITNTTKEEFVQSLYFNNEELEMEAVSMQGNYQHIENPGINLSLRVLSGSCDCFQFHWLILSENDPLLGGPQVDSIKIEITIYHKNTQVNIIGSPLILTHFPQK